VRAAERRAEHEYLRHDVQRVCVLHSPRVPNTQRTSALSTLLFPGGCVVVVVSLVTTLLASSHARADAIGPPPADCPRGAAGSSSHSGQWCEPTTCAGGATCTSEQTCEPQGLCVTTQTYTVDGRLAVDQPREQRSRQIAVSACDAGDACADGSACVVTNRCVRASLADAFQPKNAGCGCALASRASSAAGACLALAGVAALLAARGKRRR